MNEEQKQEKFYESLEKWTKFLQWSRWYPDLWYDLIKPEKGGMRLDLDQRLFLRCMSRFVSTYGVFPRGFGKCVHPETILFTSEGMKEIGSYFEYQDNDIETYSEKNIKLLNRYGKLESTNAGVYSGYKPTIKVKTEELYEVENTLHHPMLVYTKEGLVWKKTSELKKGDYLPVSRNNNVFGENVKLNINMEDFMNNFNKSSRWKIEKAKCNILEELDEELALILGYLTGDGGMTLDNSVAFTNSDDDVIENYINFMQNRLKVKVNKYHDYTYTINGKYIREYFRQIGLDYSKSIDKKVPEVIMTAPKNIVAKFIQGLFDTDGGIANNHLEYCTSSEKMSKQIQTILLNFGIISTRTYKYVKKMDKYTYTICIFSKNIDIFNKEIGFSCKRKQDKLDLICKKSRNVNKDVIPFMQNIVVEVCEDLKKVDGTLKDKMYHVRKGNNQLTYEKLDYLLSIKGIEKTKHYDLLMELKTNHYFFSKVQSLEESEAHVYDLSLPETHSFVSNGLISHNTLIELMSIYHTGIFYPDINLSMSAQTKENAASISADKHAELMKKFPLLKNEIVGGKPSAASKDSFEVNFTSGGRYNILANAQTTKGQRRHRLNIEESALLNNELFKDALEPVVNVPRRTIGENSQISPYELNGMINYVTTSGKILPLYLERDIENSVNLQM